MRTAPYDQRSPYYRTPQLNQYVTYLDSWQPVAIPPSSDDLQIRLDPRYVRRPDLLSTDLYGTPQLWWVFSMRNPDKIKDPIYDMRANLLIFAPTRENIGRYI